MARKKSKKEELDTKNPIEKPKPLAKAKTSKSNKSSEKKGKLTVSQRERDEIDAVVDALWAFVGKIKDAPRHLMVIGLFITLIGASFSGWAQELAGQEKAGYWYAFTESDEELNRGLDGMYSNYAPEDSIKIEGVISEIEYFGLLDDCSETDSSNRELCEKYPVIHSDLGIIETETYKTLERHEIEYLFPSHISSDFNESISKSKFFHGNLFEIPVKSEKFDLVLANLTSSILIENFKVISNMVSKNGIVIMSGILASRFNEVIKIYLNENFKLLNKLQNGNWISVVLKG